MARYFYHYSIAHSIAYREEQNVLSWDISIKGHLVIRIEANGSFYQLAIRVDLVNITAATGGRNSY